LPCNPFAADPFAADPFDADLFDGALPAIVFAVTFARSASAEKRASEAFTDKLGVAVPEALGVIGRTGCASSETLVGIASATMGFTTGAKLAALKVVLSERFLD
jgi:hypothetical protein